MQFDAERHAIPEVRDKTAVDHTPGERGGSAPRQASAERAEAINGEGQRESRSSGVGDDQLRHAFGQRVDDGREYADSGAAQDDPFARNVGQTKYPEGMRAERFEICEDQQEARSKEGANDADEPQIPHAVGAQSETSRLQHSAGEAGEQGHSRENTIRGNSDASEMEEERMQGSRYQERFRSGGKKRNRPAGPWDSTPVNPS